MSESMFTYNASALGIGGVIRRKGGDNATESVTYLPSQASVALSPSGGVGSARVVGYASEAVSFSLAESSVSGQQEIGGDYVTISEVSITNLNVFDRLRIAFMRARVESRHSSVTPYDSTFTLHASYNGVEIDGVEIVPVLDVTLTDNCPTYKHLDTELRNNSAKYSQRFGLSQQKLLDTLDEGGRPLRGSLLGDIQYVDRPANQRLTAQPHGYGLKIPKFGKANFAEYLVKPGRRRVTLLRLDVDTIATLDQPPLFAALSRVSPNARINDPLEGEIALASVDGNGSPPWKP